MTTITKERIELFIKNPLENGLTRGEQMELARIALASLEAEPDYIRYECCRCGWETIEDWRENDVCPKCNHKPMGTTALYTATPAPAVPAVLERLRAIVADPRALPRRKEWVSGQQYSYVLLENVEAMVDEACHAAMLQGSQPVSQTYNLPELIEGMEVSIDVSTCDADLGNRYFGTVTEALELDTAKNGYILLVQDAEPNFDVNGNSPVIPGDVLSAILKVARVRADFDDFDGDRRGIGDCLDEAEQELIVTINKHASQLAAGPIAPNDVREQTAIPPVPGTSDSWINCSDRMPEKGQNVLISVNFDSSLVEPLICSARYTGSTFRRGDATIKPGNGIEQATHWMPLPEPPQEVK